MEWSHITPYSAGDRGECRVSQPGSHCSFGVQMLGGLVCPPAAAVARKSQGVKPSFGYVRVEKPPRVRIPPVFLRDILLVNPSLTDCVVLHSTRRNCKALENHSTSRGLQFTLLERHSSFSSLHPHIRGSRALLDKSPPQLVHVSTQYRAEPIGLSRIIL